MKHLAITNMTGARNRGCEALVTTIVAETQSRLGADALKMDLHTRDPQFDRDFYGATFDHYFEERPNKRDRWSPERQRLYFDALRRTGSMPVLGSRARNMRALVDLDMVVSTGGDILTSDYGDFATHARILHLGVPVTLLAHTIGPLTASDAALFRKSLGNIALCTVRESESLEYLRELVPDLPVTQTADVAFLLPVADEQRTRYLVEQEHRFVLEGRRLIGLSVSAGIMSFRADVEPEHYLREVAAFVDALNREGYSVVFLPHVQERAARNNDMIACREVLRRCARPTDNLLLATPLSASEYKGVVGLCEALVGARTHATIGSMSQGVPTVAIAYSRKAWGIMRDYYGEALGKELTIDVAALSCDGLRASLDAALRNGRTEDTAQEMKRRAAINFDMLADLLR